MKVKLLVFVLALSLAFAACASGNIGVSAPAARTSAELAIALAVNLRDINPGSALADGDRVILTSGTGLQGNLIVPAGVTLNLTGDGGLWLHDGATLTVDGTVNAPADRIGLDRNASSAVINGNGAINLSSRGRLINVNNGQKLTLDGVTLAGIADNDNSLVGVNEGGELLMKSGAITGNTYRRDGSASGGGVNVWRGIFTMEGGTISGNSVVGTTGSSGGGVMVGGESVFIMKGGEISGNTITSGTNGANGAGVSVGQEAVFTMLGGEISGNSVVGTRGDGGGVQAGGTFTMEGGTIFGRNAEGGKANSAPGASFNVPPITSGPARWGAGGTYTMGGVPQTSGSNIVRTNETLIAIPAQ